MALSPKNSFDPSNNSMSRNWEIANATQSSFEQIMQYYRDLRNSPFKIEQSEGVAALALLVATNLISANTKPDENDTATDDDSDATNSGTSPTGKAQKKPFELVWEKLARQGSIAKALSLQTKNLLLSAAQIGTHTAKIPNTAASGRTVFTVEQQIFETAQKLPFVMSATFKTKQRIGAGGGAALTATNRFLLTSLEVDGEIVNIGDSIQERGLVYDCLLALGMDREELDTIAIELDSQREVGVTFPLGDNQRCLIWPTETGDVQITPVHPFATHFETSNRVKSRKDSPHWLPLERVKVGGANPQNAGVINNMFSGLHYLLTSLPPKPLSFKDMRYYKYVILGKVELATLRKTDADAIALSDLLIKEGGRNMINRDLIDVFIDKVIYKVLLPYMEVSSFLRQHPDDAEIILEKITGDSRTLLEHGYEQLSDKAEFCKNVGRKALLGINGVPASDELDVIFRKAAERILRNNMKGI